MIDLFIWNLAPKLPVRRGFASCQILPPQNSLSIVQQGKAGTRLAEKETGHSSLCSQPSVSVRLINWDMAFRIQIGGLRRPRMADLRQINAQGSKEHPAS